MPATAARPAASLYAMVWDERAAREVGSPRCDAPVMTPGPKPTSAVPVSKGGR